MISEKEISQLESLYGVPEFMDHYLDGDGYLYESRLHRSNKRRGEVVLTIQRPQGSLLLHRKSWYEPGVYRLLTGGIDLDEKIEDALFRELEEETGLITGNVDFLGVLTTHISSGIEELNFASYVFYLRDLQGRLRLPDGGEDISDFRDVAIEDLPMIAEELRKVPPPRAGWGEWRAIAHDFVYECIKP